MSDLNSKLALHQHYTQHCNIPNRTIIHHDNLEILRGINNECIDLIYLDPPFAKNETFIGSSDKIQEIKGWYIDLQKNQNQFLHENFEEVFKETPTLKDVFDETDIQREHYSQIDNYNHELINYFDSIRSSAEKGIFYYLIFMSVRLIEMHRILKPTGSLYLHCDPTASHYLKAVLDKVFGHSNFRNEIIWHYSTGGASKQFYAKKHDIILFYTKSNDYHFNSHAIRMSRTKKSLQRALNPKGARVSDKDKLPVDVFTDINALNPMAQERTGYPTQKPLTLLERIIKASSNKGDVVLDPFCGCATTCVAAENLGRHWVGIDRSKIAYYMVYWRAYIEGLGTKAQTELDVFGKNLTLVNSKDQFPKRQDRDSKALFYEVKSKAELKARKHTKETMPADYKKEATDLLYEEQTGICNGCDAYLRKVDLTVDHITPQAKGGTHDIDNLQLLCYRCNNWKRTGTMEDLVQKLYNERVIPVGIAKKQMKRYKGKL